MCGDCGNFLKDHMCSDSQELVIFLLDCWTIVSTSMREGLPDVLLSRYCIREICASGGVTLGCTYL